MTMEGTGVMPVYDLNNRTAAADGAGFGGGWMWVVMLFFLLAWGGGGFGGFGGGGNDNDIQGTVQRAQDDNQRAGAALDGVRDELTAAGAELAGADRDAERAEGIARQNAETIRSCREILERSKAAHQRAEQILAEIERANQTPAEVAASARNPG